MQNTHHWLQCSSHENTNENWRQGPTKSARAYHCVTGRATAPKRQHRIQGVSPSIFASYISRHCLGHGRAARRQNFETAACVALGLGHCPKSVRESVALPKRASCTPASCLGSLEARGRLGSHGCCETQSLFGSADVCTATRCPSPTSPRRCFGLGLAWHLLHWFAYYGLFVKSEGPGQPGCSTQL